ncbi:START domain-containing protein [Pseudobacteriovorax antillogorgiicola]|uniref:START domain-containing protein n=1 Tax=Pseudobacteriovorax antillogorgiicola TaxID=1513793 RepID=A0A1Y6CFW2_9BACT|nr:START domain-containing protein [Pseudobacteriovorax antillogorgiicola]TCS47678.1 START domain-containing protein [Pseudobacteriovorax antillogorgiicola]SMF59594.1 START domain-containing protein [Pseudobacteriovorax antillogorgiicola]
MKISKILGTTLTTLSLLTFPAFGKGWEKVDRDDGVDVFRKEIPGSSLVAFKGVKVMNQPITKVSQVLLDKNGKSRLEWVDMVIDFKFLEQGKYKAIAYSSYKVPWPLLNRDYVTQFDLKIDNIANQVIVSLKSVEHPDAPETIGVRANLIDSRYVLTPLPNGKTRVSVEIQTDPMGYIPSWLVNLIQKSWPSKTLNAMEKQAAKAKTPHNEIIANELRSLKQISMK